MDSKVKRIDEHLYNPARTETQYLVTSAKRLHSKTSLRYRLSKLNQPGGMFNLSGNTYNPHLKTWALLFLAVMMIVSAGVLAQGSLFHNVQASCLPDTHKPGAVCNDPSQIIWQNVDDSMAGFNTFHGPSINTCNNIAGTTCMTFCFSCSFAQVALSKITVGDLSIASKSTLAFHVSWDTFGGRGFSTQSWGYFLTTNGTVTNNPAYDPGFDPSVVFLHSFQCNSGCNTTTPTITASEAFLRTTGKGETIGSESGPCSQSGSCFLAKALTTNNNAYDSADYLNFTGVQNNSACTVSGNPGIISPAPGCSWLLNQPLNGNAQSQYWTSTTSIPWFQLQTTQYYIGFYLQAGFGGGIEFTFNNGTSGNLDLFQFVDATSAPTIDTGGFFGPVIKALIVIGVFILQNLLQFANYLWNILQPIFSTIVTLLISILAGIAAIIITVIKAVLNAIGTGLGISSLGDNLFTFLGDIASFFTTFFSNATAQLSSFLTFLTNGYSTISASFGTYWTDLTNWTSGIKDLLAGLWVIGGQVFTISFALMFSGWLLFGAKKFSDSVGEGMEWFNLTRQFLMIGVAIALFLFTMILHYVIIPSFHAIQATGEAKKTAEPDIEIGGTGVG